MNYIILILPTVSVGISFEANVLVYISVVLVVFPVRVVLVVFPVVLVAFPVVLIVFPILLVGILVGSPVIITTDSELVEFTGAEAVGI